jgi:hypothetical protein
LETSKGQEASKVVETNTSPLKDNLSENIDLKVPDSLEKVIISAGKDMILPGTNNSANRVGNPITGIYVFGLINDLEVRSLVDTGSGKNLISKIQYDKLPQELKPAYKMLW